MKLLLIGEIFDFGNLPENVPIKAIPVEFEL